MPPGPLAPGVSVSSGSEYDFSNAPVASTPEEAERIARSTGVPVEDLSARTATESHFALPEGSWAVTQYLGDKFALDPTAIGATQFLPIDSRLVPGGDAWLHPANTPGELRISGGSDESRVLLELSPEGSEAVLTVTAGFDLPRARVDGARASYEEVGEGVDLIVEARGAAFELYLVAHTQDALAVAEGLTWEYAIPGGELRLDDEGNYGVTDGSGNLVGRFAPPIGWDARIDSRSGNPVLEAWAAVPSLQSQSVPVIPRGTAMSRVEGSGAPAVAGGEAAPIETAVLQESPAAVTVALKAPDEWHEPGSATFPVVLDPYYDPVGSQVGFDTDVNSGSVNTTYSTGTELRLGTGNSGTNRYRIFTMLPLYPARGHDVMSASLQLYEWHAWSCQARDWYVSWTGLPQQ